MSNHTKNIKQKVALFVVIFVCLLVKLSCALEYEWHIETDTQYLFQENYGIFQSLPRFLSKGRNFLEFSRQEKYVNALVAPDLLIKHKNLYGYALGQLSWTNTWDEKNNSEGEKEEKFLNAYLGWVHKPITVQGGLQSWQFGEGLIFENKAPGVDIGFRLFKKYNGIQHYMVGIAKIIEKVKKTIAKFYLYNCKKSL